MHLSPDVPALLDGPVLTTVLNGSPVVEAGLTRLLEPFPRRVVLLDPPPASLPATDVVHVALYDAVSRAAPRLCLDPRVLRPLAPTARVVAVVADADPGLVSQARLSGASGAVLVSATGEQIVQVLERVRSGEFAFPGGEPSDDPGSTSAGCRCGDSHGLSGRESEMLGLICSGLSNAEIGRRCFLGDNTVKTYIRAAYRKIGVTTRAQAVIWGLTHEFAPARVHQDVAV